MLTMTTSDRPSAPTASRAAGELLAGAGRTGLPRLGEVEVHRAGARGQAAQEEDAVLDPVPGLTGAGGPVEDELPDDDHEDASDQGDHGCERKAGAPRLLHAARLLRYGPRSDRSPARPSPT